MNSNISDSSTFNLFDTSMEVLTTTANKFIQLIFCLLAVVIFARFVNFLLIRRPIDIEKIKEQNVEHLKSDEKSVELQSKKISGWESETIDCSEEIKKPQLEVPSKVIKNQLKIPKRKCISVGPVLLTPNSQIIRKLNVEEREERYRYDILPLNSSEISSKLEDVDKK